MTPTITFDIESEIEISRSYPSIQLSLIDINIGTFQVTLETINFTKKNKLFNKISYLPLTMSYKQGRS